MLTGSHSGSGAGESRESEPGLVADTCIAGPGQLRQEDHQQIEARWGYIERPCFRKQRQRVSIWGNVKQWFVRCLQVNGVGIRVPLKPVNCGTCLGVRSSALRLLVQIDQEISALT